MYKWQVVPICEKQKRDVNPEDLLNGDLYRKCNIYKGGGGYDKFEEIARKRKIPGSDKDINVQFVAQLRGCPLRCPYCYVTQEGIFGELVYKTTTELVTDFKQSGLNVFHLMGGAPALYVNHWEELITRLPEGTIFHSDFVLQEGFYNERTIQNLAKYPNTLYAVSVKGTDDTFEQKTGTPFKKKMFWTNLILLYVYRIPFYLTFTGMNRYEINQFRVDAKEWFTSAQVQDILEDSFKIDLVQYEALNA